MIYYIFILFDVFFFFKQKTAYEMRISDWSSDVCSSDLLRLTGRSACERQKGRPISDHSFPLSSSRSDAFVPSYLSLHCSPRTIRTPADWPRPPRRLEWRCESRTPPCPIRASGPRGGLRRAAARQGGV